MARTYIFTAVVNTNNDDKKWVWWEPKQHPNKVVQDFLRTIKVLNEKVLAHSTTPHTVEVKSNGKVWSWILYQQDRVVAKSH